MPLYFPGGDGELILGDTWSGIITGLVEDETTTLRCANPHSPWGTVTGEAKSDVTGSPRAWSDDISLITSEPGVTYYNHLRCAAPTGKVATPDYHVARTGYDSPSGDRDGFDFICHTASYKGTIELASSVLETGVGDYSRAGTAIPDFNATALTLVDSTQGFVQILHPMVDRRSKIKKATLILMPTNTVVGRVNVWVDLSDAHNRWTTDSCPHLGSPVAAYGATQEVTWTAGVPVSLDVTDLLEVWQGQTLTNNDGWDHVSLVIHTSEADPLVCKSSNATGNDGPKLTVEASNPVQLQAGRSTGMGMRHG